MMKRVIVVIAFILSVAIHVFATQDTVPRCRFVPFDSHDKVWWVSTTAVGAGAFVVGAVSRWTMNDRMQPSLFSSEPGTGTVDVVQYVPLAFPWVMKAFGVPPRSGWGRMATSQAVGTIAMAGAVWTMKQSGDYLRPDGSNSRSFPSGHTAWAFMGATMVSKELGDLSPWYTMGAYALASGVAMQRVVDKQHLPCDVVAGAGIGMLAAQAGYWIGDVIYGDKQVNRRRNGNNVTVENNPYVSLENGVQFPLGTVRAGGATIKYGMALVTGVKGGVPLNDRWGVAMQLAMRSTPIFAERGDADIFVAPYNSVGIEVAPYYSYPIASNVRLVAELAGGYYRNFSLKSRDRAINAGLGNAVGRLNIGARWGMTDRLVMGAGIGYEISNYEYSVTPCETYGTASSETVSGICHNILLNLSTAVIF